MIRRREFITLLGATAAAWPVAASAQKPRMTVIGYLTNSPLEGDVKGQGQRMAFAHALQQLGWTEGENFRIEARSAGGNPFLPVAADLLRSGPDVIVASSTPAVAALKQAGATIPIVFVNITDPVGQGFVTSLAKPGANITGFMNFERSMGGKWVEILREISPGLSQVAVISNPAFPQTEYFIPSIEETARQFLLTPITSRVRDDAEFDRALAALTKETKPGLIVPPGATTPSLRRMIIEAMARDRMPAIYWSQVFTSEGGLVAYGSDETDLYRRAAAYVDRILRGEKPADLPVQAPTKFELVVNLKTAKALGLTIPEAFLARADEVIE
jgi:putative ABC transport system substrate-binding protein